MMGEPKAFASLSSGLLARKGAARPMRPQGFGQVGSGLEDLGWNDMGFEASQAFGSHRSVMISMTRSARNCPNRRCATGLPR